MGLRVSGREEGNLCEQSVREKGEGQGRGECLQGMVQRKQWGALLSGQG